MKNSTTISIRMRPLIRYLGLLLGVVAGLPTTIGCLWFLKAAALTHCVCPAPNQFHAQHPMPAQSTPRAHFKAEGMFPVVICCIPCHVLLHSEFRKRRARDRIAHQSCVQTLRNVPFADTLV